MGLVNQAVRFGRHMRIKGAGPSQLLAVAPAKGPSHIAFQVRDVGEDKSYFNRIGAAFEHKDGQGFNIQLDSVPVDGRVTLRTPQERVQDMQAQTVEPQPQEQGQQQAPVKDQGQER